MRSDRGIGKDAGDFVKGRTRWGGSSVKRFISFDRSRVCDDLVRILTSTLKHMKDGARIIVIGSAVGQRVVVPG